MTDRFIQKKEIERLAECSDKGNPLLLPEREFTGLYIRICRKSQFLEERLGFLSSFVSGKIIFQLYIFKSSQARWRYVNLEKAYSVNAFSGLPICFTEYFDISLIEIDNPLIVVAIAINIAAQWRFSGAGSRFYQTHFPFPEDESWCHISEVTPNYGQQTQGKCLL